MGDQEKLQKRGFFSSFFRGWVTMGDHKKLKKWLFWFSFLKKWVTMGDHIFEFGWPWVTKCGWLWVTILFQVPVRWSCTLGWVTMGNHIFWWRVTIGHHIFWAWVIMFFLSGGLTMDDHDLLRLSNQRLLYFQVRWQCIPKKSQIVKSILKSCFCFVPVKFVFYLEMVLFWFGNI